MIGMALALVAAVSVTVDETKVRAEVPRTLYGTGMEAVNHEIYGGLDAQRLYDESFEEQEIEPTAGKGIAPKPGWVCGRQWAVSTTDGGRVLIDDAYLADEPTNAFGRIGCREDIVDAFRQEGLTFLRWGGSMANAWGYLWKNMKGDRRPYDGFWFRTSSTGFLYREFVQMAAAMKLPCAFSIYAYEQVAKTAEIAEWLKSFDNDIYVQIGNEECAGCTPTCGEFTLGDCRRYCESLRLIVTEGFRRQPGVAGLSYTVVELTPR